MKRAWGWLLALGLVVVASIAVATAPQPGTIADPFIRTGVEGEVVHGRLFDVEVTGMRLADELDLQYDESRLGTDGVWVIADVVVTANIGTANFSYTELQIDGVGYRTTSLPLPAIDFISFGAGIPVQGSLVFELPSAALERAGAKDARLVFEYKVDLQVDDIPVVVVDLSRLDLAGAEIIDAPVVLGVD